MKFRISRSLLFIFLVTFIFVTFVQISPENAPSIGSLWFRPTDEAWSKKIWQTWSTSINDLSEENAERVRTWHDKNPNYRYELLSDTSAEEFVHLHYDREPLIKDTFFALTDKILRADFLRYLVLLGEGGVCLSVWCQWSKVRDFT